MFCFFFPSIFYFYLNQLSTERKSCTLNAVPTLGLVRDARGVSLAQQSVMEPGGVSPAQQSVMEPRVWSRWSDTKW